MKKNALIITVFILLSTFNAKSQTTIGSNETPKLYETLRIDGDKKGLRLSRLSNQERKTLTDTEINISPAKKAAAKGLTIFNTTSKTIEFWDGDEWRLLSNALSFSNGLSSDDSDSLLKAKLGNTLEEDTKIEQQGHNMSFKTGDGALSINTNALHTDKSNVIHDKLDRFFVDTVLSVDNKNITFKTGNSGFSVNNDVFKVVDDKVNIKGHFQYKDGNEPLAVAGKDLILRAKDNSGKANWEVLEPTVSSKSFEIIQPSGTPDGSLANSVFTTDTWVPITNSISLEKGKWLIFGRLVTYTATKTSTTSYMNLLRIVKDGTETLYTSMTLPERKTSDGNENWGSYCVPQALFFLDASNDASYHIEFLTKQTKTWRTTISWVGPQYFYAIKIND